jgi:hypothetical protein
MKSPKFLVLILSLLLLAACSGSLNSERARLVQSSSDVPQAKPVDPQSPTMQQVSLRQADQSQSAAEAMNRKIIRNADLALEVSDPLLAQQKITSIAESVGGFVVNSESKLRQNGDANKQSLDINIVVRVPEQQFRSAFEQIIGVGSRVVQQKVTGEDVTEQFIDLEARAKTQKALEAQFLEIMKRAVKVEDALEVQRQVAEVRNEIEKIEGRKRFLENRASLSTITVTLQEPTAVVVNTSGFGRSVREAVSESISLAVGIVMFIIRLVIIMMPILILIILPGLLLTRFALRRARKMQLNREPETAAPNSVPL